MWFGSSSAIPQMTWPLKCCALPLYYRTRRAGVSTLVLSEYQSSGLLFQFYYISMAQHSLRRKAQNDEKYCKVFTWIRDIISNFGTQHSMWDFSFFFQNVPIPRYLVNVPREQMRCVSVMLLHPHSQSCFDAAVSEQDVLAVDFLSPCSIHSPDRQTFRCNPCSLARERKSHCWSSWKLSFSKSHILLLHSAPLLCPEWFLFLIDISRMSTKIWKSSLHSRSLARNMVF